MAATYRPVEPCVNIDWSINMTSASRSSWISAADAARQLRISRSTLYAYVSRGFIRSQSVPGSPRERAYSGDDVERLRRRTEERRDPDKAAARALHFGVPILESSIALIDGSRLYYRGHDAAVLARSRTIEDVASLIWLGRFDGGLASASPGTASGEKPEQPRGLPFVARAQSLLARVSAQDPLAFDLRAESVARCGWRLLRLLTLAAAEPDTRGTRRARRTQREESSRGRAGGALPIERMLTQSWGGGVRAADVMRTAIILCADHELNVSSFTARCVASAGSNPYAVVIAGLSALEGTRHGGATARVESMLAAVGRRRDPGVVVAERLRRGEPIDGFGHPLYRQGDPRAVALLAMLRERYRQSAELEYVLAFAEAVTPAVGEHPNVDFALAALARVLRLPAGSPLTLFAIGRTIGWIGHAIEQYATGQLIRPRARYSGVVPAAPGEQAAP
jgi:citrate synthase